MLTAHQRRWSLGWALLSLGGIVLFVGTAMAALLLWDSSTAGGEFFTPYTWQILRFTLWQATMSTLLSIFFGLPVALALARRPNFWGRMWIIRLMALPMGLPVLIGALGLIGIWGRQGIINGTLLALGMEQPVSIYGLSGILIAHVFFNMPLAARLLLAALERLPAEYWLLSSSLGMRPLSVFRFIEGPAMLRVLPGVSGLIFMLCATSFTLVLVLGGGPAATTLEVAIYQSLRFDFDPPRAIALAFLQIGLTALILAVLAALPKPDDDEGPQGRAPRRFDGRTAGARLWDVCIILLATLFLILPLSSIVLAGIQADLWRLGSSSAFYQASLTSLSIATAAGLLSLCISLAIVAAQEAIRDMKRPGAVLRAYAVTLGGLGSLVLLVPPVVLGTGWFLTLRSVGEVNRFAPILIVIINALMALPFVIRVLSPAITTHRRRTARLAASLGLSGLPKLLRIDFPPLAKPLLTALSFAMALSLGDLGAVALFGSSELTTLPWLVYSRLSSYRTNDADGLALLLGLLCLLLTMLGTAGRERRQQDG
jgi:thiamine transport system permease protein